MTLTSILIPSLYRTERLLAALQSIEDTRGANRVEYCVVVDESLPTFEAARDWLYKHAWPDFELRFNPTRTGALKAWNQALSISHGDILFPVGDDHIAHPRWLDLGLEAHRNILGGYGAVGFNDLMHAPSGDNLPVVCTTMLYDRRFVIEQFGGVVSFECYKYLCVDLELNERAKRIDRLVWLREAIVEHCHSANGKRPFDSIDQEKTDDVLYAHDHALFEKRKAAGWPNDFEPVIH